ncbi:MAG: T9SS type A sorting domain-containing protein [Bacteroidota bacterium]
MRIIFSFILLMYSIIAVSQEQTYFNNNYPLNWEYDANSMVIIDSTYYLSGNIARTTPACEYNLYGYHITKINWDGQKDTTMIFDECEQGSYIGWQGSMDKILDTIYIVGGIEVNNSSIHITKYYNLDTVGYYNYFNDTLVKRGFSLYTKENSLVFCGASDSSYNEVNNPTPDTTFTKGLLVKITNNGEIIFSKSYAWGNIEDGCWNSFKRCVSLDDNSIAVTGSSNDFSNNTKPIILKTDSLGNEEWVHAYGSNTYSNPRFMDIIETRDSSILVCGAYTYGETFGGLYPYDGWLLKLNPDGSTVWNRKYREHTVNNSDWRDTIYCVFVSITELDDGGLAAIARVRSSECLGREFKIYRMDSEGNVIWNRLFTEFPECNHRYYPNAIEQTADKGFAISGYMDHSVWTDSAGWITSQRIFLIKTDSLGNDSLVHISEPQASPISRYELEVYPNPASHQLHINLPANFPGGDMQVINQQGQIANTIHLPRHKQSPAELNVSSYPPGHYLLQIKTKENYFYGKFVKN